MAVKELEEPDGWVDIDTLDKDERSVHALHHKWQFYSTFLFRPLRAFVFQVAVLANHQSGRDTHIRQIKVFEPE